MMEIFSKPNYKEIAACVSTYGQVTLGIEPSLARGVARLSKHYDDINTKFPEDAYVFEVIIANHSFSNDIISELQQEIPRRYLHIPDEKIIFRVDKKELTFKYWQERMVEFTKIEILIRSQRPLYEDFGAVTDDSYSLQVYLGFDRYRIKDPDRGTTSNKACSLYIYTVEHLDV